MKSVCDYAPGKNLLFWKPTEGEHANICLAHVTLNIKHKWEDIHDGHGVLADARFVGQDTFGHFCTLRYAGEQVSRGYMGMLRFWQAGSGMSEFGPVMIYKDIMKRPHPTKMYFSSALDTLAKYLEASVLAKFNRYQAECLERAFSVQERDMEWYEAVIVDD